jgi:DNA-binding transcriptional MerR regulator
MAISRVAPVPAVLTQAGARALRLVGYSPATAKGSPAEFRIDELARAAGTTTRNVRSYQERGLLPPPIRHRGRASIYDQTHVERLKIVDSLLQRGFTAAHIGGFISCWESGKDLSEVLGFDSVAGGGPDSGSVEIPRELVDTFLGAGGSESLDRLVGLGLARAGIDSTTVTFTEPRLLDIFTDLHRYGLQLRELVELYAAITASVGDIARLMIDAAAKHLARQQDSEPAEFADAPAMLEHMRQLGISAVHSSLQSALADISQGQLGGFLKAAQPQDL